jgi:assimilatory nitrate reductase catalytic subunit
VQTEPHFIQAVRPFIGAGLHEYVPFDPPLEYTVPDERSAQCVYFRGGNSCDELVCVVLTRGGQAMRLFPIGARSSIHVPLRIVEDLLTSTRLELHVAAPEGSTGTLVVDLGLLVV